MTEPELAIAVIPVKGYSAGVPGKNFRTFGGMPMWMLTFNAAFDSQEVGTIVVTTDKPGEVYTGIQKRLASYQFSVWQSTNILMRVIEPKKRIVILLRPPELTLDEVQVDEVVLFSLRQYVQFDQPVAQPLLSNTPIMVLQPTSPLRTSKNIDEAMYLYRVVEETASVWNEYSMPVVMGAYPSNFTYVGPIDGAYVAVDHNPQYRTGRQSSDYSSAAVENGAIYISDYDRLSRERSFRSGKVVPYFMKYDESIEVDTPEQLRMARALYRLREEQEALSSLVPEKVHE